MEILILTALKIEARLVARSLNLPPMKNELFKFSGMVENYGVKIGVTGIGSEYCRNFLEKMPMPEENSLIINTGFCGGISPELNPGDRIYASQLISLEGQGIDPADSMNLETRIPESWKKGIFLTTSKVISDPVEKMKLFKDSGALSVDTETFEIGTFCKKHDYSFIGIRVVFDGQKHRLPDWKIGKNEGILSVLLKNFLKTIIKGPQLALLYKKAGGALGKTFPEFFKLLKLKEV